MAGYIEDGYTREDGYVAESAPTKSGERFWDALEFVYRPASRVEGIRLDSEVRIALLQEDHDPECAVKAEKLACDFVAKHVKGWSLKNAAGSPVAVNGDACSKLHAGLFARLYRIIRGTDTSDPKPPATEAPLSDEDLQKN